VANALIVSPLSLALLIATTVVVHHHPKTVLPLLINIVLYVMLAGPFLFLQFRRRFQSARETRTFRAAHE
jgi:hypothetical protein